MFEIVGREEELGSLYAFIGEAGGGLAALVLEGEAGIGKSTLWLAGLEHARTRGLRVLSSRPAEAERSLAHVGLGDLFADVLDDVLPALAAPRRRALEVALLREEASGDPVDDRAVAVTVHGVLQILSEREPILIAVDDVQWLDRSSSSALAFALRRLDENQVLVLLARRLVDGAQPSGLEQALSAECVQRLPVGPLSVGALHRFLRDRLDRPFARQTLLRIHERSGGNPFLALELARILDVDIDPLQPLAVPESLEELVRARISGLPASTREALALASALGTPSESLLERAGVAAEALEPAIVARVIERENGAIRFTHPLLSSVLYRDLGAERRSVHGRIAAIVEDPLAPRPSPRALEGRAGRRCRGCARRRRETGGRSWCVSRRGRARRAGAPADAAGRARRAPSSSAGCSSCASGCRRVDARPSDCDRPAGRGGNRLGTRRGACPPRRAREPRSWAPRCSRQRCARRPRARRCSR